MAAGLRRAAAGSISLALLCAGCAIPSMHLARRAPAAASPENKMRAEYYFVKARDYEMFGQTDNALRCYASAYALDPQSPLLRDLLVQKYVQTGQRTRALLLIKGNPDEHGLSDGDKRLCAGIYLRDGKLTAAVDMLEDIAEKLAEDFYMLGFIDESRGDLVKAVKNYEGFLKKKPESLSMWTKTGGLYISLKRYSDAESLYVEMERRFGQAPEVFNGIGRLKLARGDTSVAVNSFKMASLIDTANEDALRNLAQIYMAKGQGESAIPYYEKLYAADRRTDPFGRSLVLLYYYMRHFDKAHALASELLLEKSDDYELHFYNGLALVALDSASQAHAELEKTISIRSDFPDAWEQLCYLELKEKRPDSAAMAVRQFKKNMPRHPQAWRMEGYLFNMRKEYAKAVVSLKKSLELDSTDALAWFELGTSLERLNEWEQATSAFKRALALRPGDPAAANYLGYMWAERGVNLDSAKLLIKMALSQDAFNGAYLDSYAWVFYKTGDIDSALTYMEKAVGRIADDPVVYSHYGDILLKKGNVSGALAAYRKALDKAGPDSSTPEEINALKNKISEIDKKTFIAPPAEQPSKP
jgi:tetratricopeptide (TPR) repeat protein